MKIGLEEKGQLARFEEEYQRLFTKDWSTEKGKVAFALSEASRVLHSLDPATYPMADSWVKAVKNKADITPGKLAERASELMKRRRPGQSLMFVVDEVGQFVARDVQKMLDLQAVVQSLGVKGRGKHWVVVTSQEKLGELVSGLDDKKIELARLMDRFPLQVHLEPSDISEVTSRRVLSKNAAAQAALGKLFDEHRGRLTEHTRLTADIKLPELSRATASSTSTRCCRTRSTSSSRSSRGCARRAVPASTSAARTARSSSSRSSCSSTRRSTSPTSSSALSCGSTRSTTSSRATSAPRCAPRSPPSPRS